MSLLLLPLFLAFTSFAKCLAAATPTYIPGNLTVEENGIVLSTGLTSRVLAQKRRRVPLVGGGKSKEWFHAAPDGAAIFLDESNGGYVYVSNSEKLIGGGVGAIYFNAQYQVTNYKRLLRWTKRNCGGGKTWWNTWLSGEEVRGGHVWEVDPFGRYPARETIMGRIRKTSLFQWSSGARYESMAYDRRDVDNPTFYMTIDEERGPLVRFTPDPVVVEEANASGDYSRLLHEGSNVKREFLLLDENSGTFTWTLDIEAGSASAEAYFSGAEGIDIRNGTLYFTAKTPKLLLTLDLDAQTYTSTSTESGAFDQQPDQLASILGASDEKLLYFCEDGALFPSGVHARDSTGKYFTILHGKRWSSLGEVSGLAFSPDNMRMYVAFYLIGKIYEIRRTDGLPFGGQRLDIQYHVSKTAIA